MTTKTDRTPARTYGHDILDARNVEHFAELSPWAQKAILRAKITLAEYLQDEGTDTDDSILQFLPLYCHKVVMDAIDHAIQVDEIITRRIEAKVARDLAVVAKLPRPYKAARKQHGRVNKPSAGGARPKVKAEGDQPKKGKKNKKQKAAA